MNKKKVLNFLLAGRRLQTQMIPQSNLQQNHALYCGALQIRIVEIS